MASVLEKKSLTSDETQEVLIQVVEDKTIPEMLHPDCVKVGVRVLG